MTSPRPSDGKPRPGGRKILFHGYAVKLINSKYPLPPPPRPLSQEIRTLAQDRKASKSMEVDCWHHWEPHERLSRAEGEIVAT